MTYPRGPQLYAGGMMLAYRTTPADGVPAELWELRPELATQGEFVAMFVDMAKLARLLATPLTGHVVHATELELVIASVPWVPMTALINGVVRRGPLDPEFVITFVRDVAAELARAADRVVFRSLSPSSLAITASGAPRLLDLAIAKWQGRLSRETQSGIIKGELSFMAPEQARGMPLDGKADVFALALIAIELLTGTRVYRGAPIEVLRAIQSGLPALPSLRDYQPATTLRLLDAMTAHHTAGRLSAAEVVAEIESWGPSWPPEKMFEEVRRIAPAEATSAIEFGY